MSAAPFRSIVFLSVHLAVLAMAAPAHAASPDAPAARSIALPAGPLGRNLSTLAVETGIALSFDPALTAGLSSPALSGSYAPREALARLLAGSGLELVGRSDGSYTLQKAAPAAATSAGAAASAADEQTLAAIRVRARRAADGSTEGTGSYTSRVTSIASKTDQSFREIPQSVSVVTRQQLDDQDVKDIGGAMALTPGITLQRVNGHAYNFYSRGFQIDSMQIDGGAPFNIGSYTATAIQDMAMYDRVEVMRGASGLLSGAGDPGGIINLARKKPLEQRQLAAALSAGSWSNYRADIDATGPLTDDGRLRGRVVAMYENDGSFMRHFRTEKALVYAVLEADLPTGSLLTVGGSHSKRDTNGSGSGLPRYADGTDLQLPRSTNLSQPWGYVDNAVTELFAQLEHRFATGWKLKLNASHVEQSAKGRGTFTTGAVQPGGSDGVVWAGTRNNAWNHQNVLDLNLTGNFKLLGRTHELLLGADRQKVTSYWDSARQTGAGSMPANPFNPDATPWSGGDNGPVWYRFHPWEQEQYGAYGTVRLHPSDQLHVVLGARLARYKFKQYVASLDGDTGVWAPDSDSRFSEPTKLTPYGGIIYDLNAQWSAYASYSAIFKPQALYKAGPMPGTSLKPITGKSYEGGFKGELLDGRLNATFSLFHVERNGEAVLDPGYPEETDLYAGNCCYLPQGKVTSRGADMEVGGELLPGLQAAAGYTFNHSKNDSTGLPFSSITPKHLFKLSTAYTLPGVWSAWKVGGNVAIQSASYTSGTVLTRAGAVQDFQFTQGGYAVWSALAQYRIDPRWSLALNVNNLFDKHYYEKTGYSGGGNWYGAPRNASVTLRATF